MRGNFSEVITASIEWTKTMLFRPFNFKKWLFLYLIVIFAFQMQSGCSTNLDLRSKKDKMPAPQIVKAQIENFKAAFTQGVKQKGFLVTTIMLSLVAILVAALILISQWFYSVFSFVFIDAIVKNDASIKEPFKRNKGLGKSYLGWNIAYLAIFVTVAFILAKSGFDSLSRLGAFPFYSNMSFGIMASTILPYIAIGFSFFMAGGILSLFITDYCLIIMYKESINIFKAIPKAFKLLASDIMAFVKYVIVKIGLYIVTAIIGSIFSLFVAIFLILPAGLIVFLLILLYKIMPGFLKFPFAAMGVLLGIPVGALFLFLIQSIFLPFSVFHKTFNIKFIARIDERYDLFRLNDTR